MSYLNGHGLNSLWAQIDDVFARLSEAGHNIALADTTITLYAVDGTALASIDLNSKFPTKTQAAGSLSMSGSSITLKAVDGTQLSSVDIGNAISSATSGFPSTQNTGRSLNLSGKRLELLNAGGGVLSYVNLP